MKNLLIAATLLHLCFACNCAFSDEGDFDYKQIVRIVTIRNDGLYFWGLPRGYTIEEMGPNHLFVMLYNAILKHADSLHELDIDLSTFNHELLLISPSTTHTIYIGEFWISDGINSAFLNEKDRSEFEYLITTRGRDSKPAKSKRLKKYVKVMQKRYSAPNAVLPYAPNDLVATMPLSTYKPDNYNEDESDNNSSTSAQSNSETNLATAGNKQLNPLLEKSIPGELADDASKNATPEKPNPQKPNSKKPSIVTFDPNYFTSDTNSETFIAGQIGAGEGLSENMHKRQSIALTIYKLSLLMFVVAIWLVTLFARKKFISPKVPGSL